MHRIVRSAVLALVGLLFQAVSLAGPGELDPAFGSGGIASVPASLTSSTRILATARQADGRILVAGDARASEAWSPFLTATPRRPVIGRLNPDGSVDTSFGLDGWVVPDIGDFAPEASAVAIAPTADGKVLVGLQPVGQQSGVESLGVMRLASDGSFDTTFAIGQQWNRNGLVAVFDSQGMQLGGIAEQPGGAIVLAVSSPYSAPAVYSLDAMGNVNYGFGASGKADLGLGGPGASGIRTLRVRSDGSIFAGGWVDPVGLYDLQNRDAVVVKVSATGTLDPQFGAGGKVTYDFATGDDEVVALAEDAQGRLVAAGKAGWPFVSDGTSAFGVARLDATTGALDATFANAGKLQLNAAPYFIFESAVLAIQFSGSGNGDMLLGGYGTNTDYSSPESVSILARIDSTGQPVQAFGVGGVVSSPRTYSYYPTGDVFVGLTVESGTILAIGTRSLLADLSSGTPPVRAFALRERFAESNGAAQGDALTGQGINTLGPSALGSASLSDGRFVTVGSIGDAARVMRFLPTGELDAGFADAGRLDFHVGGAATSGRAIAVDAAGNMLVASAVPDPGVPGTTRWSITRWTADGALDPAFGNGDSAVNAQGAEIAAMAVQPDGKVVVAGSIADFNTVVVARLNADGSPDSSFAGGVASFPALTRATALALQSDGRILVAGYDRPAPDIGSMMVVRLTQDGQPDADWGFGTGRAQIQNFNGGIATANALSLQGDGKVIVAGMSADWTSNGQPVALVARLDSHGNLDPSFGIGGFSENAAGLAGATVTGIGVARDGKIVAGGDYGSGNPFVMRLNGDGSLDATYNGAGYGTAQVQSGDWIASILDTGGKARLLGYSPPASGREEILLAQFQGQTVYDVPDPFQFPDALDVPVGQLVTSAPATITGINVAVPITVINGEYSVGCNGTFTAAAGTITNGQSVCVRHLSSLAGNTWTQTQLTVGTVVGSFSSVTGVLPETSIGSTPPAYSASTSATFAFTSPDGTATFRCSLDDAAFAPCTSPATYGSLAEGGHRFRVEAVNRIGADASPAEWSWRIDLTPPRTTIDSGPSGNNNPDHATIAFSSNEAGARFECSLDFAAFTACSSPLTYTALDKGPHLFAVRARDLAGNVDPTPAAIVWRSH